jgi:hypothetical protein
MQMNNHPNTLAMHDAISALRRFLPAVTVLACSLIAGSSVNAQSDDDDTPAAPAQVMHFEIQENQFEQWVFQNWQSTQMARTQLEKLLGLQIDDVDRAGKLTETQRKKVQLAGGGDIKRFFEQVEVVRNKFLLVRKDQQRFNEIWQDIQPLQMTINTGLFEDGSLFHKTLRKTLTAEQSARYDQNQRDRRAFRYQAKVALAVAMLENAMPLRDEQRQQFIRLLMEETKPPRKSGQHDYYVIMWQASRLPEDKLKPLFDAAQWKVLSQQFTQMRGMEQFLKQNGGLALDGEVTAGEDAELTQPTTNQ